jgi:hypothetical protein
MTKQRQSHREAKKRPTATLKEKRSAKKAKKQTNAVLGDGKPA